MKKIAYGLVGTYLTVVGMLDTVFACQDAYDGRSDAYPVIKGLLILAGGMLLGNAAGSDSTTRIHQHLGVNPAPEQNHSAQAQNALNQAPALAPAQPSLSAPLLENNAPASEVRMSIL